MIIAIAFSSDPCAGTTPQDSPRAIKEKLDHYVVGHGARKLFQCNGCRHQTSLTAGSLMEHTKLPLTTWFLAIYLISQAKTGLSSLALKRQVGVSYPTARARIDDLLRALGLTAGSGPAPAGVPATAPGAEPIVRAGASGRNSWLRPGEV